MSDEEMGLPEDDGGMQWHAERRQQEDEAWERAQRDSRLLEEHRQWVKKFHEDEQREKEQRNAAHY